MDAYLDVRIEVDAFSKYGYGNTVGYATIDTWTEGAWAGRWQHTFTTLEPAGSLTRSFTVQLNNPRVGDLFRLRLRGQAGQGDEDPWPFMPVRVRVEVQTVEA